MYLQLFFLTNIPIFPYFLFLFSITKSIKHWIHNNNNNKNNTDIIVKSKKNISPISIKNVPFYLKKYKNQKTIIIFLIFQNRVVFE